MMSRRPYFFLKACCYFEIFFNGDIVVLFKANVLKEVCYLHYLHNNNTVLLYKVAKYGYRILHLSLITFFYTLLFFDYSTIFFINEFFLKS